MTDSLLFRKLISPSLRVFDAEQWCSIERHTIAFLRFRSWIRAVPLCGGLRHSLFMRKTLRAAPYFAWSLSGRARLVRFGLTARVSAWLPLLARCRLSRQRRQRFSLLEIYTDAFSDTVSIRRQCGIMRSAISFGAPL